MEAWQQAETALRKSLSDSMSVQHFQYAGRAAFNLAWTYYRAGRHDGLSDLAKDTASLAGTTSEMTAFKALKTAVERADAEDGTGHARALLACAAAAKGNIDLWDASDIAARALAVAQQANAADLVAEASAFISRCREEATSMDLLGG
jgi:hypothetical protein